MKGGVPSSIPPPPRNKTLVLRWTVHENILLIQQQFKRCINSLKTLGTEQEETEGTTEYINC